MQPLIGLCILLLLIILLRWLLMPCDPSITLPPPAPMDHSACDMEATAQRIKLAPKTGLCYLVIGTGSVGTSIIEALLERGEEHVKGFDIAHNAALGRRIVMIQGNVTKLADLTAACQGVDVVFSTFALIRFAERLHFQYAASHAVNVTGTANTIAACQAASVRVLVVTSTSNCCVSPVACKERHRTAFDETSRYVDAEQSPNHYGWTKVQAEQLALAANGSAASADGTRRLSVACLRPCSAIFGPTDTFICQKWLDNGECQLVTPEPIIDWVYVENVTWGHLLLERKLLDSPTAVGGLAFCVSGEQPLTAGDFYAKLGVFYKATTGTPLKFTYLPRRLMILLSYVIEAIQWLTHGAIKGEAAQLTPAMFAIARCSYTFSSQRACELLGYKPLYTVDEGLQRTVSKWDEARKTKR